jgi:hypothetical protein
VNWWKESLPSPHPPGSASANTNPEDRAEPGREPEADGMRGGTS